MSPTQPSRHLSTVFLLCSIPLSCGGSALAQNLVKDIHSKPGGSGWTYPGPSSHAHVPMGSVAYFAAASPVNPPGLWKTDGTRKGTVMVWEGVAHHRSGAGGTWKTQPAKLGGTVTSP